MYIKELNARVEKDYVTKKNWETELQGKKKSKVRILNITDWSYEKKQKELNKVFEGDKKNE